MFEPKCGWFLCNDQNGICGPLGTPLLQPDPSMKRGRVLVYDKSGIYPTQMNLGDFLAGRANITTNSGGVSCTK
jgi:hypothetical protein